MKFSCFHVIHKPYLYFRLKIVYHATYIWLVSDRHCTPKEYVHRPRIRSRINLQNAGSFLNLLSLLLQNILVLIPIHHTGRRNDSNNVFLVGSNAFNP